MLGPWTLSRPYREHMDVFEFPYSFSRARVVGVYKRQDKAEGAPMNTLPVLSGYIAKGVSPRP